MDDFDLLVEKQLQTMDKLLFIQAEIERCQQVEQNLNLNQNQQQIEHIQSEMMQLKEELKKVHAEFKKQTEDVITCFQDHLIPTH